jgi:hypothetical protein
LFDAWQFFASTAELDEYHKIRGLRPPFHYGGVQANEPAIFFLLLFPVLSLAANRLLLFDRKLIISLAS